MKFIIQRVTSAQVYIQKTETTNAIGEGLLVYVWIHKDDVNEDRKEKVDKFVRRVDKLQLFDVPSPPAPLPTTSLGEGSISLDSPFPLKGRKNAWLRDIGWELLVISNFTLYGRNKKAGSVDFTHAAKAVDAEPIYDYLIQELVKKGLSIKTWEFGALMEVSSVLMGPLNLVLEW